MTFFNQPSKAKPSCASDITEKGLLLPLVNALNLSDYKSHKTDGFYVVAKPAVGAVSLLTMIETLAFEHLEKGDIDKAISAFEVTGLDEQAALKNVHRLIERLKLDGWTRESLPVHEKAPFGTIYLTITRDCNLACPYCYQGLTNRRGKTMSLEQVNGLLNQILDFNDSTHVIVTGGEPMMHPEFKEIVQAIENRGMTQSILTNGAYLDDDMADFLETITGLERIQISIDGMKEDTNALSRGRATFQKTVDAIELVAKRGLPFLLNPTIHEKNADEIIPIAKWALSLGGSVSANDLRHVPNDMNDDLFLTPETLSRVRMELSSLLVQTAKDDPEAGKRLMELGSRPCSTDPHNARFICGVAHSLVDIDWNGDTYPCHMIKGDDVKLGNVFERSIADILAQGIKDGWRKQSHEIDGCSSCSFVSTCASGCRAKTYYTFGRPDHRSPTCEDNGRRSAERMMIKRGFTPPKG